MRTYGSRNNDETPLLPASGIGAAPMPSRTDRTTSMPGEVASAAAKGARSYSWLQALCFVLVLVLTFSFQKYCVYETLSRDFINVFSIHNTRRLEAATSSATAHCVKGTAGGSTVGAAVGLVAVPLAFLAIGLSPIGPIAGGWFAANMGAGLAAGSTMAGLQAAAMTGAGVGTATGVGGAVGAGVGASMSC